MPVENGAAGAQVVAGVVAGDAVHRVLPQISLGGGLGDGITAGVLQFELIEAHALFDLGWGQLDAVLHPEARVHAWVTFVDGSTVVQAARPDMSLPIQLALSWPERWPGGVPPLHAADLTGLTLRPIPRDRYPALAIALEAGRAGGTAPCVLNAVDEVAVQAFLDGAIALGDVPEVLARVLGSHASAAVESVAQLREVDARARSAARAAVATVAAGRRWVDRLHGLPVVVWGDFLLDEYWQCRSTRVSREAPVLVLDYRARSAEGGGAANAALNLAALGARVAVVGWTGNDAHGREIRVRLRAAGCDVHGLIAHPRAPTVVKTRIVAGDVHTALQQVVRVDRGEPFPLLASEQRMLAVALQRAAREARAVVLSDYGYDSVTPALSRPWTRAWRRRGLTVGLDARYRLAGYRSVSVATPNEGEAAAAAGMSVGTDAELTRTATALRRRIGAEHLIVTRGRDGLTLWGEHAGRSLPAWGGEEAVDVTGAGDAVVAAATLALAAGAPALEAAGLANVAGSVAVGRRGAVAVTATELRAALDAGR